jgi:hypothetical protein
VSLDSLSFQFLSPLGRTYMKLAAARFQLLALLTSLGLVVFSAGPAWGQVTALTIDPNLSSLTLVGSTFDAFGTVVPVTEQDAGSLMTQYAGMIMAELDLVGNTINFLDAGTELDATISGNWRPGTGGVPAATDLANYGLFFHIFGTDNWTALRNFVVGAATDSPVSLTSLGGGAYSFPSTQTIKFNAPGTLDWEWPLVGHGSETSIQGLSGPNQAVDGGLQDNGDGTFTVTVPVNATVVWMPVDGAFITFQLTGSITGTSSAGP